MIRIYEIRRRSGTTLGPSTTLYLCDRHLNARKIIGWEVGKITDTRTTLPDYFCRDCKAADEPTVMDRIIEADDRAKASQEPTPVPVLPGQRRLW